MATRGEWGAGTDRFAGMGSQKSRLPWPGSRVPCSCPAFTRAWGKRSRRNVLSNQRRVKGSGVEGMWRTEPFCFWGVATGRLGPRVLWGLVRRSSRPLGTWRYRRVQPGTGGSGNGLMAFRRRSLEPAMSHAGAVPSGLPTVRGVEGRGQLRLVIIRLINDRNTLKHLKTVDEVSRVNTIQ